MAVLPVLIPPHPLLKTKAKPVDSVDDSIRQLIQDMLETMYAAPGIGLAATQIGVLKRVIVLDVARQDEPAKPQAFVNPEITWHSDEVVTYNEGCLSLPDHYADVERPAEIELRYLDRNGNRQQLRADGLLATCIQHETDHLNGILFVDHLSALKRNIILRKLAKQQRAKAEAAM
jgi:peptide deformylase